MMAKGKQFNPKTLKQLAEDAVTRLKERKIGSVTSKLTKIRVEGEEVYKCSAQMTVKIVKKDSEEAQRQILEIHKRVKDLNDNHERMNIKLKLDKSVVRKKWIYKRFKYKKTMDYDCQFSFSVAHKDILEIRDTSENILDHIEAFMIIYYEDPYKLKFNRGSRTESGSTDDTVEITYNPDGVKPDEMEESQKETRAETSDNGMKLTSHDPQYHVKNDNGTIHFEDKSKKNHYHIFNCFNTGRKDGNGCCSALVSVFKFCLPCIKKT